MPACKPVSGVGRVELELKPSSSPLQPHRTGLLVTHVCSMGGVLLPRREGALTQEGRGTGWLKTADVTMAKKEKMFFMREIKS